MSNFIDLKAVSLKLKVKEVEIPELGGHIFVKELTGKELDSLNSQKDSGINPIHSTLFYGCCDENGKRIFNTNDELKSFLEKVPATTALKICSACSSINDFISVEEEAKNS